MMLLFHAIILSLFILLLFSDFLDADFEKKDSRKLFCNLSDREICTHALKEYLHNPNITRQNYKHK